ncbi:hypothetical protein [Anaerotignum sp.]|nr:hypothetical protein [Anaerotignum sp.]
MDEVTYDDCEYLLIYKNKIVQLNLEEPVTEQQISTIIKELKLNKEVM